MEKTPIALASSDWHIRDKPPIIRNDNVSWEILCLSYVEQVINKSKALNIPIIIAGDIFHYWWGETEGYGLINKLADLLNSTNQKIFVIYGQHDLPNHRETDIKKSAWWTLLQMCPKMINIVNKFDFLSKDIVIYGVPFGNKKKITSEFSINEFKSIAVIHELIWINECFPGCNADGNINNIRSRYQNFDMVIAGDNHDGFIDTQSPVVVNCGSMRVDTLKQVKDAYKPFYVILYDDLSVKKVFYETNDAFKKQNEREKEKQERLLFFAKALSEKTTTNINLDSVIKSLTKNCNNETTMLIKEIRNEYNRQI